MSGPSGDAIVAEVKQFVGGKYVYGGTTPSGFDCSGLTQYVLTKVGIKGVPRTSEEQWAWVTKVSRDQLAPGDLVFAQFPGDNASPGHVGIYTGNGQVLSAEDPAAGIGYSSLASWGSAIVGYGRAPNSSAGTQTATLDSATSAGGLIPNPLNILSGLTAPFQTIATAFKDLDTILTDILNPSFWLRIGAFIAGVFFLAAGIWCLIHASDNSSLIPPVVPV